MALNHAILALLIDNAYSGYDLAKDFDQSVNFFWKATHQQIYRELSKLEDQKFVEVEIVEQDGRPDKKLYHITEAGKAFLTEWLLEPCDMMPIKEDLLVKLWAAKLVPISDSIEQSPIAKIIEEFQRHQALHQQRLATYHQIATEFYPAPKQLPIAQKYFFFQAEDGIRYEEDYVAWCDEVLELFANHADVKGI
ncbi:PadR family transcriptional regulator [Pseudanabaenaceae cyanobacterium LEGE 13415]|nr:PadR family transcriptional regulator [Pseudanabaenaceae cyanobacterium LEGE 13415]